MGGLEGWLASGGVQPLVATLVTGLGGGGLFVKWLEHGRRKRKQSDEVALSLVDELRQQMADERTTCHAKMEALDAKLASERSARQNLETCFELLLVAQDLPESKRAALVKRLRNRLGRTEDPVVVDE